MNKEEQESLMADYHRLGNLLVKRDTTIKRLRAQVKELKEKLRQPHGTSLRPQ